MVTVVVWLLKDVSEMLLLLCVSWWVVDMTGNGGLIVGYGNIEVILPGTRSPQLFL